MSTGLVQTWRGVGLTYVFQKRLFAGGGRETNFLVLSLTIARVYKMWDCNMFLSETSSGEKAAKCLNVLGSLLTQTAQSKTGS